MYEIIIIGSGTAGLTAVKQIKRYTDNYLLVNHGPLGTTCARVGCMPSKALIHSAELYHIRKYFNENGIIGSDSLKINIPTTLQRVRELRDYFVNSVINGMKQLNFIEGKAIFLDDNTIKVNETPYQAKQFIIATGSTPLIPNEFHEFKDRILTSDSIFEQSDLPQSIACLGTGATGIELCQALARLGINVTALSRSKRLSGIMDPAVADYAFRIFSQEFSIWFDCKPKFSIDENKLLINEEEHIGIHVDKLLVASGRKSNLYDLGLENTSTKFDNQGFPIYDPETLKIQNTNFYLVGDALDENTILHEASDEGYYAALSALSNSTHKFVRRVPLKIIFTRPNIVCVGQTFNQLDLSKVAIGEVDFSDQGRAKLDNTNEGIIRIYIDKDTHKIIGSEMIAPEGEHLGHLLALAIQQNLTASELLKMPFYHPAIEEGLRVALRNSLEKSES
jgi:dihydrolipoamide dehydrogenase